MGCQHYGDRGGAEWCDHYNLPIRELKQQPVKPGEEVVVDVTDIHRSGSGVGRTDDGFIVLVDGVLPDARARVKITKVRSNHAIADELERIPMDEDEDEDDDESEGDGADGDDGENGGTNGDEAEAGGKGGRRRSRRERLGSRDNFWGG